MPFSVNGKQAFQFAETLSDVRETTNISQETGSAPSLGYRIIHTDKRMQLRENIGYARGLLCEALVLHFQSLLKQT